jgi:site-specific DNA recombinase
MQRAALYARVSTDLQEKEQTIQSQLAAITHYADEQGFRYTPALTYKDDGYSGTWLDRPGLDELRDHAREGRFDVVVVLCPDRLARRYAYQVLLLEELKRTGIEVHFCERPIGDTRRTINCCCRFKGRSRSTSGRSCSNAAGEVVCTAPARAS